MVQRSFYLGALLSVFLLSGCTSQLDIYTITGIEDDAIECCDYNKQVYDYDGENFLPKGQNNLITTIAPLDAFTTSYDITHVDLNKYTGKLEDAIGYYKYLMEDGYESIHLLYNYQTFDCLLQKDTVRLRILYLGSDVLRIFVKDDSKSVKFPPYINSKGEE